MGVYNTLLKPTRLLVLETATGKRVRIISIAKYRDEVKVVHVGTGLPLTLREADIPALAQLLKK